MLVNVKHDNIVQFLGLCILEGSEFPILVMERLDSSLEELLKCVPNICLGLKESLLKDVARGLSHLHNSKPPMVHGDLSVTNVLLTSSLMAKIRPVSLDPGLLASTPDTTSYVPSEVLDIFSFGHLAMITLTQVRKWNGYITVYDID